MRALVTGASGFVGRRLAPALLEDGHDVRCLVRNPAAVEAGTLVDCELVGADLAAPDERLDDALAGVDVAYYLVHMMGRSSEYGELDVEAAREFAKRARRAGVRQMVYLGGLGSDPGSPHLRSRQATAEALAQHGPPLTYLRASMVIGAESESYVLLRSIVDRLLAIPSAGWMEMPSQPIGARDLIAYLRAVPATVEARGREIELGGPDVLRHRDTIDELARQLGRRPPLRVPLFGVTPGAVAAAARAVTRGNGEVAQELVKSLPMPTVVEDRSGMELFDIKPEPISVAFQRAIEEEERMGRR